MTLTQEAPQNSEAVMPRADIADMLDANGILWRDSWGIPPARTFEDFCNHHENDRLFIRKEIEWSDKLIFDLHAAVVIVTYQYNHQWFELYEARQVFRNGKSIERPDFDGIGETIKRGETAFEGAKRCLREELSFDDPSKYELSGCFSVEHRDPCLSEKWPGIWAAFHRHKFRCVISRDLFRPDGYIEMGKDGRAIYFLWRRAQELQLEFQL